MCLCVLGKSFIVLECEVGDVGLRLFRVSQALLVRAVVAMALVCGVAGFLIQSVAERFEGGWGSSGSLVFLVFYQ